MAKDKPWYVSLIIALTTIVCLILLIVGGTFLFFKIKYQINIFSTISQVRLLNQPIDERETFTYQFSEADIMTAQTKLNTPLGDFIVKDLATDNYTINTDTSAFSGVLASSVNLTDKEMGALINVWLTQENKKSITIAEKTLNFDLIQVKFANITENSADVNVVAKVKVSELKESMSGFFMNILKKFVPDYLYISSTVTVTKGATPFEYTTTSKDLAINKLTTEQTASLINTINCFYALGNIAKINSLVSGNFVDGMIGNDTNQGFATLLQTAGVDDYNFANITEKGNFVLVKNA